MKRLLVLACLLLPTAARAAPALLDIYQDEPDVQEQFRLFNFGDREELTATSNAYFLPRQEFGKYVRAPTDLPARIETLVHSIDGTGFKVPRQRTTVWPNWHVSIKGQEIDASDPRFNDSLRLLKEQMETGAWRRKDVTVVTLKMRPFQLLVTRLQYSDKVAELRRPHVTRQILYPFDACKSAVSEHLVCKLSDGFIYLDHPSERKH